MKAVLVLLSCALALHAQSPRLLPIQRLTPSTNTPPYVWWVLSTNSFGIARWHVQGSQTLDYCDDVILTWTTQPGRYYSVETGWLNGQPWVTIMPPLLATTNSMGFRTGTKFSSHFFRVREW